MIREDHWESIPGYFWFQDAYRRIVDRLPRNINSAVVEVGSFRGRSTAYLCGLVIAQDKPVTIHAVDDLSGLGDMYGPTLAGEWVVNLAPYAAVLGDRLRYWQRPSQEVADDFADGSVAAVWLDGSHDFESVLGDISAWWGKLEYGGWMGGDDWLMQGVRDAVRDQFGQDFILGPGWATDREPAVFYPWWMVQKR